MNSSLPPPPPAKSNPLRLPSGSKIPLPTKHKQHSSCLHPGTSRAAQHDRSSSSDTERMIKRTNAAYGIPEKDDTFAEKVLARLDTTPADHTTSQPKADVMSGQGQHGEHTASRQREHKVQMLLEEMKGKIEQMELEAKKARSEHTTKESPGGHRRRVGNQDESPLTPHNSEELQHTPSWTSLEEPTGTAPSPTSKTRKNLSTPSHSLPNGTGARPWDSQTKNPPAASSPGPSKGSERKPPASHHLSNKPLRASVGRVRPLRKSSGLTDSRQPPRDVST